MAEVGGEEAVERGGDRQSLVDGAVAGVVDRDARALNVVRWRRAELRRPAGDDPILAREEKSGRRGGLAVGHFEAGAALEDDDVAEVGHHLLRSAKMAVHISAVSCRSTKAPNRRYCA